MNDLFKEPVKKAFDFASETTKQLITLSTAIIALTITFAKDILQSVPISAKVLLMIAWAIYLLSLLFGLLTLMALTSELEPKIKEEPPVTSPPEQLSPPSIWAKSITAASVLQILTFLLATVLVVVSGVVSTISNINRTDPQTEPSAVKDQQRDLFEALALKNIETFTRICGDDYLFTDDSGEVINKPQVISSLLSGTLSYEQLSTPNTNVRFYGNTALADGDATMKGRYKDREINGRYRFTAVFVKREDRWQGVALQFSSLPALNNQTVQKNPIATTPRRRAAARSNRLRVGSRRSGRGRRGR